MKKSALNFRKMRESDDLIDESVVLWDRLNKDGYLLFRQVLDASAVHRMRGQFLDRLYGTGVVDPDSQDLTYNGADLSVFPVFGGIADVLENYKRDPAERPTWRSLVETPSIDSFFQRVLGERSFLVAL